MDETGNVFDASATLTEIEELPESEHDRYRPEIRIDPLREEVPATEGDGEPDYFVELAPPRKRGARRRALTGLALVAGAVLIVALAGVATGSGDGHPSPTPAPSAAQPERSNPAAISERIARVVSAKRALQAKLKTEAAAERRADRAQARRARAKAKARAIARSRRHRQQRRNADSPSTSPAPPEPAPTATYYVPAETAPPPSPAPAPSPGGGASQEFGIEP